MYPPAYGPAGMAKLHPGSITIKSLNSAFEWNANYFHKMFRNE